MSLEQYFNRKKSIIVTFFNNFQHLLHELSIVVQLQIDNQYFTAKNVMKEATSNVIDSYCRDMMGKENDLLRRITETVCEHVGKYCGLGKERVKTLGDLHSVYDSNHLKIEEKKPISTNVSQPKRSIDLGRAMSLDRLQNSQLDKQTTASKMKNIRGIQSVGRNSVELFNMKTKTKQHIQNEQEHKTAIPINLLNKKRQNSSRKSQQDTSRKQSGLDHLNVNKPVFRNYSGQIQTYTSYKQRRALSQLHEKLSYQKYRQYHHRAEDTSVKKDSNIYSSKASEVESKPNGGIMQNNQILCEKLDQRIQESAMEMLNKVKPKRSPLKKKNCQSINGKVNKSVAAFSVMDISQNSILYSRPSVLRIQK